GNLITDPILRAATAAQGRDALARPSCRWRTSATPTRTPPGPGGATSGDGTGAAQARPFLNDRSPGYEAPSGCAMRSAPCASLSPGGGFPYPTGELVEGSKRLIPLGSDDYSLGAEDGLRRNGRPGGGGAPWT